jgi:two-component system OmpR family response regulator
VTASRRILVVEDDEGLRETLAEVMADEGHEVRSAAHGAEALDRLREWVPDLIVLDVMMPTMDAFEFRGLQRLLPDAAGARVLVLSAARDIGAAAARLGADAWLTKPFALGDVIEAVERLLDTSAPTTRPEA